MYANVGGATLSGLPFVAIGVFALVVAVRFAVRGEWQGGIAAFALVGLVFALVGASLIAAAFAARRSRTRDEERRGQYPAQPWMWRDDWASGRIPSTGRPTMIRAWTFALLWNLCSAPLLIAVALGSIKAGPPALIASIFPVLGLGLLIWAIRATLRYKKFGRSVFEMTHRPAAIGGKLSGRIYTRFERVPDGGVLLKLSNIRRTVRQSSDGDSVNDSIVWREEQTVPAGLIEPHTDGWAIPVAFQVPADGIASSAEIGRDGHLWRLAAEAEVSGTNFREQFEVPVFGRAAVTDSADSGGPERAALRAPARLTPPSQPTIAVSRTATGGAVFDFAAARNAKPAAGVTMIFLLWSAALAELVVLRAPTIFVIIWGLFDLVIFVGVLRSWLASARLTIDAGEVRSESSVLGISRSRSIPLADIGSVEMPITTQANDTPYYAIRLILRDGRKITAGSGIRDKREAEWIVAEIRRIAGI
jgi:hypothetical protein